MGIDPVRGAHQITESAEMTRDELAASVPIREWNGRPFFVLVFDIPEPWQGQYNTTLELVELPGKSGLQRLDVSDEHFRPFC